jgi:hypothetical protein
MRGNWQVPPAIMPKNSIACFGAGETKLDETIILGRGGETSQILPQALEERMAHLALAVLLRGIASLDVSAFVGNARS